MESKNQLYLYYSFSSSGWLLRKTEKKEEYPRELGA
jgi:hypothetical protein